MNKVIRERVPISEKKILISHLDLDGHGVITIALHYNDILKFNTIRSEDYGFEDIPELWEDIKTYNTVIIADLSMNQYKIKELRDLGIHVEIYDHHSQADWVAKDPDSSYSEDKCGTKLFWEYYVLPRLSRYPKIIDEFVELVNTYDLWKQESPLWEQAKNLNNIITGLKNWDEKDRIESTREFYHLFEMKVKNLEHWTLTRKEDEIVKKAQQREEDVYKRAMDKIQIRVDSRGNYFAVIAIPSKISIVCSRILEEQESLDYIVAFNTWGGLSGKLSFRSRNGFNCNDIGSASGHDAAAGGQVSIEQSFVFLEDPELAFTYNEQFDEEDPSTVFEKVEI